MTRKGRPSERRPPRGPSPGVHANGDPIPDLLRKMRLCLRSKDPVDLLMLASGVLATGIPREVLLPSYLELDLPETTAMLIAMQELVGDLPGYEEIAPEVARRHHDLPAWLEPIGLRIEHTAQLVENLGDGEDVFLGLATASGYRFTLMLYIDHTMGTVVKDAQIIDQVLEVFQVDTAVRLGSSSGMMVSDLDAAEAAARLAQAMANNDLLHPEWQKNVWPICRTVVEWAVRRLPAGGTGYRPHPWTDAELAEVERRFLASPLGAALDADARHMVASAFAVPLGRVTGDPLIWSPTLIEVALAMVFPAAYIFTKPELRAVPTMLRALVQYGHAERGVDPSDTAATLAAIDHYQPAYLAHVETIDPFKSWRFGIAREGLIELLEDFGGPEGLNALHDRPLPSEPFKWTGIADDIKERVLEVLQLAEGFCQAYLTAEHRTVCRRLLAKAARNQPAFFRKGKPTIAAAALCWAMGQNNGVFGFARNPEPRMLVKTMLAHFGVGKSVSARGDSLVGAAGYDVDMWLERGTLGDPRLMVSSERRDVMQRRIDYMAMLAGENP